MTQFPKTKNTMNIKVYLIAAVVLLTACQPKNEESAALKEARETYSRMIQLAHDSKDIAAIRLDELRIKADSMMLIGDSILATKLIAVNHKLDSLHIELDKWKKQAEEMKAHSSLSDGTEPHDHHHHNNAVDYSSFSDEQLLELQVEMENQVISIKEQMNQIQKELIEDVD